MHPGLPSRERCTKSSAQKVKTFYGEIPILEKMPYLFRKFYPNFLLKNFLPRSSLGLNHPRLSTSISTSKNYMVGESWNVFTIRVLVEKHIIGLRPSLAPLCQRPCSARKKIPL